MTAICEASSALAPEEFCGAPATAVLVIGCVHEHVRETASCVVHADEVENRSCRLCWMAAGHLCPLRVLAVCS